MGAGVVVQIDDLGFADVSYTASMWDGFDVPHLVPQFPTPNIDALAMDGVRLRSYYVDQLCSPSRTSLMGGRYAYTLGVRGAVAGFSTKRNVEQLMVCGLRCAAR